MRFFSFFLKKIQQAKKKKKFAVEVARTAIIIPAFIWFKNTASVESNCSILHFKIQIEELDVFAQAAADSY